MINRDDLKAYVDGELSPVQMAAIRDAIDGDPVLAQEVEQISNLTHTIRASVPMPEIRGLDETLSALRKSRNPMRSFGWPIAIVGACGVLFAIVFPVFSQAKSAAKASSVAYLRARERQDTASDSVSTLADGAARQNAKESLSAPLSIGAEVSQEAKRLKSSASAQNRIQHSAEIAGKVDAGTQWKTPKPQGQSELRKGVERAPAPQTPPPPVFRNRNNLAFSPQAGRDAMKSSVISEPPTVALSSVREKPVVLLVDSIEDARTKVANLVEHFDGTVAVVSTTADGFSSNSNELVLMVPVAKAPEALDVIRTVVTAPFLRREATGGGLAGQAPSNAAKMDKSDVQNFGGGGGGIGGGIGGGFGGGAARGGAGGPGSPPATTTAAPGGATKVGVTLSARSGGAGSQQGNLQTKLQDFARSMPPTLGNRSTATLSAAKKKSSAPLRRIVIVLKKRAGKPNATDHR